MTVVSMAFLHAGDGGFLLAASDNMLSGDGLSQHLDTAQKVRPLYPPSTGVKAPWLLGFAGDPSHDLPLRAVLRDLIKPGSDANEVVSGLCQAYKDYRRTMIEHEILGTYGGNYRAFLDNGLDWLGPKHFNKMCRKMDRYDLDIDFLLAGWGPNGAARMVSVCNPGVPINHVSKRVSAIGEGAALALGHLFKTYDYTIGDLKTAKCRVLESKFIAEANRAVGPDTTLLVLCRETEELAYATNSDCERYRKKWEARRRMVPSADSLPLRDIPWV